MKPDTDNQLLTALNNQCQSADVLLGMFTQPEVLWAECNANDTFWIAFSYPLDPHAMLLIAADQLEDARKRRLATLDPE